MSVTFIRGDITKLNVDAIVNAANSELRGGGGVDGAIHDAAGDELYAYCKTLGGCPTGGAKISPGFRLPAKYIIHTVGPVWRGGAFHEKTLLTSCYLRSLELAQQHNCKTVAFPLISAGAYGYPYDDALQIAYDTCHRFLQKTKADIEIFIVLYQGRSNIRSHTNRAAFELPDADAFRRVADYIRTHYHFDAEESEKDSADAPEDNVFGSSVPQLKLSVEDEASSSIPISAAEYNKDADESIPYLSETPKAIAQEKKDTAPKCITRFQSAGEPYHKETGKKAPAKQKKQSLFDRIFSEKASTETNTSVGSASVPHWKLRWEDFPVEETFTQMLLRFMKEKNMNAPELYNEACLDRKLFSKIQSDIHYQPKKYTAVKLALALKLSPKETDALLETAGFALSRSKITDLVIAYCISHDKRAVWEVNGILEDWGLATI